MRTAEGPTRPAHATPSRGIYVHVPYCRRRCPYCDFAIEVRPADARFAAAVIDELSARAAELGGSGPAHTLSFGGGTPSALPVRELARVIEGARRAPGVVEQADAEVSLELNPEDVDVAYARDLVAAGFTRASLGIQSFDDDVLSYLGRAHDGARARDAVKACVAAGLRVGVDLIVGVPGERDGRLARDVDEVRALEAGHVSAYLLTLEEGTPLVQLIAKGARQRIDDDMQADAYERVQELVLGAGYRQYEVSSYARPGEESRHNRLYWQGGTYLGVGPSAHSMRRLDDGSVLRRNTTARLDAWLASPTDAAHDDEVLAPHDAFREAVAFGLRDLLAGVSLAELATRHGLGGAVANAAPANGAPANDVIGDVERALVRHAGTQEGLVVNRGGRWHLTHKGARFADRVARAVLADDVTRR